MHERIAELCAMAQRFLKDEHGQDIVEYAVVMGLIALGAVATMNSLATSVGSGFSNIGTKVTNYTS